MSDPTLSYLIDTDWVIDYLLGRPLAQRAIDGLRPAGIAISAITYLEVMDGIVGGREREQAEAVLRAFLEGVPTLVVDRAVAERTAELRVDLRRQRRPITNRALDLIIAATAIEHGLLLVSRNSRDYSDVPTLLLHTTA